MKPSQVLHQLDARLRNLQVGAMVAAAATGDAVVAGPRGDDVDHPVPAGHQQPLQICHRRRQRDFVDDDEFAWNVIEAVFLLCEGRELAVTVGTAEAGIVQTVLPHLTVAVAGPFYSVADPNPNQDPNPPEPHVFGPAGFHIRIH
jgi:hypothetical protein